MLFWRTMPLKKQSLLTPCRNREYQVILDAKEEDKWLASFQVAKEIFMHHILNEEKELFSILQHTHKEGEADALYEQFENVLERTKELFRGMVADDLILLGHQMAPRALATEWEETTQGLDQRHKTYDMANLQALADIRQTS